MKRVYDAFIEFTQQEKMRKMGGGGREKGENSCVKKTDPLHLCTHFTLKTLYKHKERKTAALTSRLCALG